VELSFFARMIDDGDGLFSVTGWGRLGLGWNQAWGASGVRIWMEGQPRERSVGRVVLTREMECDFYTHAQIAKYKRLEVASTVATILDEVFG
jgi:hypothetical protein